MALKINTHKFESRVAGAAQRRPIGRKAESKKSEAYGEREVCPKCGSKNIHDLNVSRNGDDLEADIVCDDCGHKWYDNYSFSGAYVDGSNKQYYEPITKCPKCGGSNLEVSISDDACEDFKCKDCGTKWYNSFVWDDLHNESFKKPATSKFGKKSEATSFGAGMSKRTDFSKMRNLGEVINVLEEHRKFMENKAKDLAQSKEDLAASIKALNEFSAHVLFLKQQSVKGIKDALTFNKSPEVKAAADVEQHLKDALKILYSDYENIPDVTQLLTVIDSRYATRGDKVVTAWVDNANRAIEVDAKTIKDSIADGLVSEEDVVKLVAVTSATHGKTSKFAYEKLTPVLERMNALLATAPKIEEAVIDPKEFKELRDIVEQIVKEASAPKTTIKTTITTLSKGDLEKVPKESLVSEGLIDKLKELVATLKDKISTLWNSFTSMFFSLEDEALESADTFAEVEEGFAVVGIVVESYVRKVPTLGKKFEVLTKGVLHCCDKLVKDGSLAGEFDDEIIYAEEAVKNAVESFQALGEACKTLKNALSYHKNEDNMNVIGILADAITQIVNDDNGGSTEGGEESSDDEENDVIDDVEREYSPAGGEGGEEGPEANGEPNEAPNPANAGEPEPF